jgi:uncharacterized protein (TIRG00374 family)
VAIRVKTLIQYSIMLAITALLVWFSLGAIHVEGGQNKWDYIMETWSSANSFWLMLMLVFVMISHVIRAERWRMLLKSTAHSTSLYNSFLSLMIGYLVNLVVPRGGEVSRCYNLYRLDRIPVEVSFGTVVVERIADLLCLAVVLVLAFAIESEKLFAFIATLPLQLPGTSKLLLVLGGIIVLAIAAGLLYRFVKHNDRIRGKLLKVWSGFLSGLVSVTKLENRILFLVYTVSIWMLYFLMSYAVIKAFDQTAHLGFSATLTLFAIGTIAMAAPLPGGTGSYHVLLPAGMVLLYQIGRTEAVAFTFVFHGWQTLIMIVGGFLSLILSSIRFRRKPESSQPDS